VHADASDRDFGDFAALMQGMDLVVTSGTVTAHLARFLGAPVWTLLHWDAVWLWQFVPDRPPWYSFMPPIRQEAPRDWPGVLARLRADLAQQVAARGKAS
jgi:hypothetical protein